MDPNEFRPRRNTSIDPSAPPDDPADAPEASANSEQTTTTPPQGGRLRALTDLPILRGRSPGWSPGHNYSPLSNVEPGDSSPTPAARQNPPLTPQIHLTIPEAPNSSARAGSTPSSPLDGVDLQAALAGVSFGPPLTQIPSLGTVEPPPSHVRRTSTPSILSHRDGDSLDNEREPALLDVPLIETIPIAQQAAPPAGHQPRRLSSDDDGLMPGRTTRGRSATVTPGMSPSMLGDDLNRAEEGGLSPRSILRSASTRSTSPSSPLSRTGTILRQMSSRIVNLSNEQDVVGKAIRRKASLKPVGAVEEVELSNLPRPGNVDGEDTASEEEGRDLEQASAEHVQIKPLQLRPAPPLSRNPFKGKSLGIFPPESRLRMKLCNVLVHPWTEPTIFGLIVLQTIVLAVDCNRVVTYDEPENLRFGTSFIDYVLLALFSIYSVELATRIVVSGFLINPREYSTINRQIGWRPAIAAKMGTLFTTPNDRSNSNINPDFERGPDQPGLLRAFTMHDEAFEGDSRYSQRARLARRAFLRHSFNRLDFIAVFSFWVSFILQLFSIESGRHAFVFRMLSCLRILRLLYLTSGTTVILRSLKKAAPLLLNVGFLIGFFWLIFSIIGIQSFKSSLRRQCFYTDPTNPSNTWNNSFQFCGGHYEPITMQPLPWLKPDGTQGAPQHKGYLCPPYSVCLEQKNPYNGTLSFDNIANSAEMVFVLMTTNTWSDIMYYLMNSDYLAAALFFVVGMIILFFWMLSLLIAVITSSFQVIREESKTSAFTGEVEPQMAPVEEEPSRRRNGLKQMFDKTKWLWIGIITFGLVVQCLRSASMGPGRERLVNLTETIVTFILFAEIIIRFAVDWRNFHRSKQNLADLAIAIITTVIQIPAIHQRPGVYSWFTFFQVLRIYRVVLAVPLTRDLIMTMLRNVYGLLNLILFVFLFTFLAAILAAQLFRGTLPLQDSSQNYIRTNFNSLWNSFLGMYQIFSSENWTNIMYYVQNYDAWYGTAWVGAAFLSLWFILSNFVVLNMFIAVIQENFDVSEDEKRLQQVRQFLSQRETIAHSGHGNLALSSIFRYGLISGRRQDPTAYGSAATELLLRDAVVKDFLDQEEDPTGVTSPGPDRFDSDEPKTLLRPAPTAVVRSGTASSLWSTFIGKFKNRERNPFYSHDFTRANEEVDPTALAKQVMMAQNNRRREQRAYLQQHPNYNKSLFVFPPGNPIRRICQRIVGPGGGGDRIEGVQPSLAVWYAFSACIYVAVVAMVVLACITTPLYQKGYFQNKGFALSNWFVWSDIVFAIIFTVEAIIKVIADGFFWTPHAYFRTTWGFLDGIVLVTLWINIFSLLYNAGEVSRVVGAFKALRALRLLNISDSARENFYAVIIRSGFKVLSAAFVSLALLFPFAMFGLNLFANKFQSCNDNQSGIDDLNDCVGEGGAFNSPFNPNWNIYSPRVAANPYYNFDNFGSALFILFQIVTLEGWIDVMWTGQGVVGAFRQQVPFKSPGNAVFFVIFNLLGAVFVMQLFVSVFMRNYTEMTGVAFLTTDQRSWLELRKLLVQISPSKRPVNSDNRPEWRKTVYRLAVTKTGPWQRFVTCTLVCHLLLLCTEFDPAPVWWDKLRDGLFLLFTAVYIVNITIRIYGLTWPRFRKSSWDLFSIVFVSGTFVSTILVLARPNDQAVMRIQKLFLVTIVLLLIPRNNQLDQLFKTAAASLPLIGNLLATWFVMYLVFAIALTQAFALTKFGSTETNNINLRTVPKALILLFRMSVGEGWNAIMEDYATMRAPFCTEGNPFKTDCGSAIWARTLFILWNIVSMYIFVNLFISLVFENFSYVYQQSSGLSAVSREEIRRFKEAWAVVDPDGTGYIQKDSLSKLLRELSGVFEMRIYDGDFTVKRLIDDCSKPRRDSGFSIGTGTEKREVDVDKLNARLRDLPVRDIRRRRARLRQFYEEVLVSADRDRGISFTSMLLILAHYKVINDNRSLRLTEFLRRKARLQRVEDQVRRQIVINFFDTCYWRRIFRRHQERQKAGRMETVPMFTVPEIFVEDEDEAARGGLGIGIATGAERRLSIASTPRDSDASSAGRGGAGSVTPPGAWDSLQASPVPSPQRLPHAGGLLSSAAATAAAASAMQDPHPGTAMQLPSIDVVPPLDLDEDLAAVVATAGSTDGAASAAARSRANSAVSAQEVLEALDQSAWGESLRRSFSQHRRSPSPRGGAG